jgi:predicted small metal-binding protein
MKRFRCGDVVPGCTVVFDQPSEEGILAAVAAHASRDHGLTEVPPALVAQVRALIQDIPTAA